MNSSSSLPIVWPFSRGVKYGYLTGVWPPEWVCCIITLHGDPYIYLCYWPLPNSHITYDNRRHFEWSSRSWKQRIRIPRWSTWNGLAHGIWHGSNLFSYLTLCIWVLEFERQMWRLCFCLQFELEFLERLFCPVLLCDTTVKSSLSLLITRWYPC